MLGGVGVGARHQVEMRGGVRAGGVHLLAVDHPLVAVLHRAALQRRKVRAGLWLGEAEREGNLAADEPGDVVVLLLVGAGRHDGRSAAASAADADADAGELLLHDVLAQPVAVLAAVLLRPAYAQPALVSYLAEQLRHQRAAPAAAGLLAVLYAVHFVQHVLRDVLGDEVLDLQAQGFLFRVVTKIHRSPLLTYL